MKKILIIDDDPMVIDTYGPKFRSAGYEVETAPDGETGLAKIESFKPDLIHLDLLLPKFDGVEIIKVLRSHEEWKRTPIVVLSTAYNSDIVQEAWKAGATICFSKHDTTPTRFFDTVHRIMSSGDGSGHPRARSKRDANITADLLSQGLESSQITLREAFVSGATALSDEIGNSLHSYSETGDHSRRTVLLAALLRKIHRITGYAGMSGFRRISHLAGALEVLIGAVLARPEHLTPSCAKTIFYGIVSLRKMIAEVRFDHAETFDNNLVMAVDDDPVSLEVLSFALDKAGLKPICLTNPAIAIQVLAQNRFDLVFLDIDMPGVSGLDVCKGMKTTMTNRDTPVIFVTGVADYVFREKTDLHGGDDLIAKPFLAVEVAVKALVFRFRERQSPAGSSPGGAPRQT